MPEEVAEYRQATLMIPPLIRQTSGLPCAQLERVGFAAELDAVDDVPPLVRAPKLQPHTLTPGELQEVESLAPGRTLRSKRAVALEIDRRSL